MAAGHNLTVGQKEKTMRNCSIRECKNGWVLEMDTYGPALMSNREYEQLDRGPYVFTDWNEMMEFIAEYFAEEEE